MKTTITDFIPNEFFFIYDVFLDKEAKVQVDWERLYTGIWVPATKIHAAILLVFSTESGLFYGEMQRYTVQSSAGKTIKIILAEYPGTTAVLEKKVNSYNKKTREQLKTTIFWNKETKRQKEHFFCFEDERLEGFSLKKDPDKIRFKLGNSKKTVNFLSNLQRSRKPWKIVENILKKEE